MRSQVGLRCAVCGLMLTVLSGGLGCGDRYAGKFRYRPNPYATTVASKADGAAGPVEMLAAIRDVREVEDGEGATLHATLHLENLADRQVRFDPGSLALFSADLRRFGEPETTPSAEVTLDPGGSMKILARFPFPEGLKPEDVDMSGLNLRWTVQIGDEKLTRNSTFTRIHPRRYYTDPRYGWGGYYGTGGGVYFRQRMFLR